MSKTEEKTLLSQNWAQKMFYVILPAYFKELQKYQNLQFLVKTSPKITFYIVREYYINTIYIFTMEIYHNMQYEINGWLLHRFMRTPLWTALWTNFVSFQRHSPMYHQIFIRRVGVTFLKCKISRWTRGHGSVIVKLSFRISVYLKMKNDCTTISWSQNETPDRTAFSIWRSELL